MNYEIIKIIETLNLNKTVDEYGESIYELEWFSVTGTKRFTRLFETLEGDINYYPVHLEYSVYRNKGAVSICHDVGINGHANMTDVLTVVYANQIVDDLRMLINGFVKLDGKLAK